MARLNTVGRLDWRTKLSALFIQITVNDVHPAPPHAIPDGARSDARRAGRRAVIVQLVFPQGSYSGTGPTVPLWAKFKQKKPGVCGTHKTLYYFRWVVTSQISLSMFHADKSKSNPSFSIPSSTDETSASYSYKIGLIFSLLH